MEFPQPTAAIRLCAWRDLNRVIPIYNHYVAHTIVSLDLTTKPLKYMQDLFNGVNDQELPFLVVTCDNPDSAFNKEDIIGYAYANYYRRLPAFGGTVEVLIYLDPNVTGQGIGEKLLKLLMDMLRAVRPGTDRDHGIREVLAIVPVEEGRDASAFFSKMDFEDRGVLRGVGWKMGRWIDTRTFQRSLAEEPTDEERAAQRKKGRKRHWWKSMFRRR